MIGEDVDDAGTSLDLLVQPLQRVKLVHYTVFLRKVSRWGQVVRICPAEAAGVETEGVATQGDKGGQPAAAGSGRLSPWGGLCPAGRAHRFVIRHGIPYDDLFGAAYEGLCVTALGIDASIGHRPSSYVVPKVKGELLHHLRDKAAMKEIRGFRPQLRIASLPSQSLKGVHQEKQSLLMLPLIGLIYRRALPRRRLLASGP